MARIETAQMLPVKNSASSVKKSESGGKNEFEALLAKKQEEKPARSEDAKKDSGADQKVSDKEEGTKTEENGKTEETGEMEQTEEAVLVQSVWLEAMARRVEICNVSKGTDVSGTDEITAMSEEVQPEISVLENSSIKQEQTLAPEGENLFSEQQSAGEMGETEEAVPDVSLQKETGKTETSEKTQEHTESKGESLNQAEGEKGSSENQSSLESSGQQTDLNPGMRNPGVSPNSSRETLFSMSEAGQSERVPTSQATLVEDVGSKLAAHLTQKSGTLELNLEPESLGKLTIRVAYEAGRAEISIFASNPKTLELLSQKSGELAAIIEEKTGQNTEIHTYQPEQSQDFSEKQGSADSQTKEKQQENSRSKREQSDAFAQQLRLGLI